ncbi:MAG TPA: ABC transporter ATP-binding protein [Limnobacter sp.]|nr:ABC transporter ATP-binding protein [Limnobacter sp.]
MILQTEELSVGYGGCAVLEGIRLEVKPGEILCLLGRNGSGKSSLIKTLLNLVQPVSGQVLLDRQNIHHMQKSDLARCMAYVPQSHANSLGYSVGDMVLMGRTAHWGLFGGPAKSDHQRVDECLEQLGVAGLRQRDFSMLSGGQQQLVLIARALCQGAEILLLDEPTANLDLGNSSTVLQMLLRLAKQGKSVVFSSHNPQDALDLDSHACLLENRRVLALGPASEVVNSGNLSRMYGLPVTVCKAETGHRVVVTGI